MHGERPVTIGYGTIDPHRAIPNVAGRILATASARSKRRANLRLDHMKQVVAPPVKVMRGRKVDLNQVQRRGQNSVIQVQAHGRRRVAAVPDVPPRPTKKRITSTPTSTTWQARSTAEPCRRTAR
jgi:hypothetical protein